MGMELWGWWCLLPFCDRRYERDTGLQACRNVSVPGCAKLDGVIDHYEWAIEYYTPIDGHTSNNIIRGSSTGVSEGASLCK
jgi:hypothetical protein